MQAVASYYKNHLSAGLLPNDLTTMQNYANAAYVTLNMNQYLSNYSYQLTVYNYNVKGIGTVTGTGWMNSTYSFIFGRASLAKAQMQLLQTKSEATIDSLLTQAKKTVTDQTMYQGLVTQATYLKNQIDALAATL